MPKRVRAESREGMRPLLAWLPKSVLASLDRISRETGLTRNEVVRRAVNEWLKRHRKGKGSD